MAETRTAETTVPTLGRVRCMPFMPGNRAEMIAKVPRFAPDVAVADLEDAVAAPDKPGARPTALAAIDALDPAGPSTVLVRVNPIGTPWFADDLAAAAGCAAVGVVVPKLETSTQLAQVRDGLDELAWPAAVIVAGIETALGVADAPAVLAGGLSGAYFGAEDHIADIGGRCSPGGDRHFHDDGGRGAAIGYQGKICIHLRQVPLARQVSTPTPDEVAPAREVVAAGEPGVGVVDGQMAGAVHVRMARAVLARAEPTRAEPSSGERPS
jgi:citrate lyase subunit beta/citryl-CoA lyase